MSQIPCRLSIISRRSFCPPNIKHTQSAAHTKDRENDKQLRLMTFRKIMNECRKWEVLWERRWIEIGNEASIRRRQQQIKVDIHTRSRRRTLSRCLIEFSLVKLIFSPTTSSIVRIFSFVRLSTSFHTLIVRSFLIRYELSSSFCTAICVRRLCDGRCCGLGSHHGHLNFIISMKTMKKSSSSNIRFFSVLSSTSTTFIQLNCSMKFKCHRLKINKIFFLLIDSEYLLGYNTTRLAVFKSQIIEITVEIEKSRVPACKK